MRHDVALELLIQMRTKPIGGDIVKGREKLDHLIDARMAVHCASDVELDAIAGRKEQRFGLREPTAKCAHRVARLLRVECELLAHVERRGGVIESQQEQSLHQCDPPAGMSCTTTSTPIISTTPSTLSIAVFRPRKLGFIGEC